MTVADNPDLSSRGQRKGRFCGKRRFPGARALTSSTKPGDQESATGSVGSAVKGERVGIPKSWAEKNKKDDEYEKKQAAEVGGNETQAELPRTDETQAGGNRGHPGKRLRRLSVLHSWQR